MISDTRRKILKTMAWIPAVPVLSSCATNLATGRSNFSGFVSPKEEMEIGRKNHDEIVSSYGGQITDTSLANYITGLGNNLVNHVEYPEYAYSFTPLNTDIVNAFAAPGGFTYFTKGIMMLCSNEAEFTSVMAHELGHINARHIAEKVGDATVAGIFSIILGTTASVFLGSAAGEGVSQLVSGSAAVYLQRYNQKQEYEADMLAVRYMNKAGYDVDGIVTLFKKLRLVSIFEAQQHGLDSGSIDEYNFLATHPRTLDRIKAAMKEAGKLEIPNHTNYVNSEKYLRNIDGMPMLRDPKEGMLYRQQFVGATARVRFEIPSNFFWDTSPSKRLAVEKTRKFAISVNQVIQKGDAKKTISKTAYDYLVNDWKPSKGYTHVEKDISIKGCTAAAGYAKTDKGVYILNLAVMPLGGTNILQISFIANGKVINLNTDFVASTVKTIRSMAAAEISSIGMLKMRIQTVRPGDTIQALSSDFPYTQSANTEYFRIINGMEDGTNIKVGQLVKIARWG